MTSTTIQTRTATFITLDGRKVSSCCRESVTRQVPGRGPWSCNNCYGEVAERPVPVGTRTPNPLRYSSRAHFTAQSQRGDTAFDLALHRVAEVAVNAHLHTEVAVLVDYMAERVEQTGPEMVQAMRELLAEVPGTERPDWSARLDAQHTETARTACVAMGVRTGSIAPCDFPVLTRYWLACRNVYLNA